MDHLSHNFKQKIFASPKMACAECGSYESVNGTSLLVCSKCKNHQYCGTTCQKMNWPTHKKNCRKPLLPQDIRAMPENVPCVFTTPGFMPSVTTESVAHTEGTYPRNLLTASNVFASKVSELLGTPLLIIQSPVGVQPVLDPFAGTSKLAPKEETYNHASMLNVEVDVHMKGFGRPTKMIEGAVALVRKDGKFLDWRIVQHMVMYLDVEILKLISGEVDPPTGNWIQSTMEMLKPEPYRKSFWAARKMMTIPAGHWADPGWGKAIAEDPF